MEVLSEAPPAQRGLVVRAPCSSANEPGNRSRLSAGVTHRGSPFCCRRRRCRGQRCHRFCASFRATRIGFVWSGTFTPGEGEYAAGILVIGTLLTTGVALVLAGPVGIGAAIALSELMPKKLAATASTVIELLAAVPSIVVGLWALLVLEPMFAKHVEPFLGSVPVVGDFFSGPALRAEHPPCVGRPGGHDTAHAGLAFPDRASCGAGGGQGSGYGARGDAMAGNPQGGRARRSPRDCVPPSHSPWAVRWGKRSP